MDVLRCSYGLKSNNLEQFSFPEADANLMSPKGKFEFDECAPDAIFFKLHIHMTRAFVQRELNGNFSSSFSQYGLIAPRHHLPIQWRSYLQVIKWGPMLA